MRDGVEMDVIGYLAVGKPHYTNSLAPSDFAPTCYAGNLSAAEVVAVFEESFKRQGVVNARAFVEPAHEDDYWG